MLKTISLEWSGRHEFEEHLIETGYIKNIVNMQIQFYDFVPNAKKRMLDIQKRLSKTHELTYQYGFIWENWKLIAD